MRYDASFIGAGNMGLALLLAAAKTGAKLGVCDHHESHLAAPVHEDLGIVGICLSGHGCFMCPEDIREAETLRSLYGTDTIPGEPSA